MFIFDSDTLRYLLGQLKTQIDKKVEIEQYAIKAEPTDDDAFLVGSDILINDQIIQDLIAKGVEIKNGDKVLIRNKVLSEVSYTQSEKDAMKEIIDGGGLDNILDARLDGLSFAMITKAEYEELSQSEEGLLPKTLYIVTDKTDDEVKAFYVDDYLKQSDFNAIADQKVDVETYEANDGSTKYKVLSERNFTEEHAQILDGLMEEGTENLVLQSDIVDNLTSTDSESPLSANQGRVLKEEYLGNKKHIYVTKEEYDALTSYEENVIYHIENAEELYGLTDEQMDHLKAAFEHTLIDESNKYASRSEVYAARKNAEGMAFSNLAERLFNLDEMIDSIYYDIEHIEEVIDAYGVHVDFEEQEITRTLKAKEKESDDFNYIYPWAGMRRVNILNGEVGAYEGETGYKEDGSNGDVMVEIPKFYYKVIPLRTENASSGQGLQLLEAKWMISSKPLDTFKIHPAFVRNGEIVDSIYVGAFEASVFDTSENRYNAELNANTVNYETDYLSSIVNIRPMTNVTLENYRRLANNKGEGYCHFDFTVASALQLLFLIEHGSFDSQNCIGNGFVNGTTEDATEIRNTGDADAIAYRGIENLWGNVWSEIDGFYVKGVIPSWSNDNIGAANYNNYSQIGFKMSNVNLAYIDRIGYDENNDFVFLPTRATGASNIMPNDNIYYQVSNQNVYSNGLLGGRWKDSEGAGLWCWCFTSNSTGNSYGARLQFYK